jgi:hypothetical protein
MRKLLLRLLYPSFIAAHHLDLARLKARCEKLTRLSSDMLSVYGDKEVFVTDERIECWKQEWSDATGMDYNEYH